MQRRFAERHVNANVGSCVVIGQCHGNGVQHHQLVSFFDSGVGAACISGSCIIPLISLVRDGFSRHRISACSWSRCVHSTPGAPGVGEVLHGAWRIGTRACVKSQQLYDIPKCLLCVSHRPGICLQRLVCSPEPPEANPGSGQEGPGSGVSSEFNINNNPWHSGPCSRSGDGSRIWAKGIWVVLCI